MMYPVSRHFAYAAVIGLGIIPATVARAEDEDRNDFVQTNLVSDIPGLATITDRELLNPWGVSQSPTSPPLRRQWRGKRQRRRLRQLIRPAEPRGRRVRRPLAADRARPVQRAGDRRRRLRDLCARGPRQPDQRPVGRRGRGDL